MPIASPMTLTFTQGHKCVSNLPTFNLQYLGQYISYHIQTRHGGRPIHTIIIMLMLDSVTWTLIQGHSGSAKGNNIRVE